jgi:hypothetical protein
LGTGETQHALNAVFLLQLMLFCSFSVAHNYRKETRPS